MERTHEPCVPTYPHRPYECVKWLTGRANRMHVGTHGPCVRSKHHVYMHNILNGTDARAVRPYMPLARKSSCHSPNPKVQYSMSNVQSQQILKFNIQSSIFKAQVPILPYRSFPTTKRHASLHHMACVGPASRSGSFKFFLGLEPSVRTYQRKEGDIEAEGLPCRDVMAVERGAR